MDFLRWIRNFSKKYKNRGFQTEIRKEKQQKYLFRDSAVWIQTKRWGIFREKKRALKPFANFFQEKIVHRTSFLFEDQKILWYIGIFLMFLCGYILLFSSYFQISPSKVLIENNGDGIDINIAYRAIEDIYGQNVFLFDESSLAQNLKKYQSNIEKVSIERLYPNGLKIVIKSFPILYKANITSRTNKSWWLSWNGVLVPLSKEKIDILPSFEIISDIGEDELLDYKNIISEWRLLAINKVLEILKQEWSDIRLGKIRYLAQENELHISLDNGWKIFFALQDFLINAKNIDIYANLKNQILTLKAYIKEYRSVIDSDGLVYIDVRIPGKIFICKIKDVCVKNLTLIYWDNYQ